MWTQKEKKWDKSWIRQKEAILEALYLIFIDPINKDHQDDEDENNTFFTVSMWEDELVLPMKLQI